MTRAEYLKIISQFRGLLAKYGRTDLAQDFAHAYLVQFLSGKHKTQRYDQFIVDEIRRHAGRPESFKSQAKHVGFEFIKDPGYTMDFEHLCEAQKLLRYIPNPRSQAILWRYCQGENYAVIGKDLGISESRVWQIIRESIDMIRRELGLDLGHDTTDQ